MLAIDLCLHSLDLLLQISILLLVEISTIRRDRREDGEKTLDIVSQFAKLFENRPGQHFSIVIELLLQPKQRGRDRRKDAHRLKYNLLILRESSPFVLCVFKFLLHIKYNLV